MQADAPPQDERPSERDICVQRRRKEALAAGLTLVEARLFAESDRDVGQLRMLVRDGCPAATIARILL
jgi:hypothetical protein